MLNLDRVIYRKKEKIMKYIMYGIMIKAKV